MFEFKRTLTRLAMAIVGFALVSGHALANGAPPLVDIAWLAAHACDEQVVVIDVRRSRYDYEAGHVPCAIHTNFYEDGWRVTSQGVVQTLPSVAALASLVGALGIDNQTHVVIYASGTGEFDVAESTAIYFTFRYLGHELVSILDGGLPAWTGDWQNDIEVGEAEIAARQFVANPRPDLVATRADMVAALEAGTPRIDLRSHDMFLGINAAPVLARHGTIPGALNMPMRWLTVDAGMTFRTPEQLRALFAAAGAPVEGEAIYFCNAGLESSVGWFAAVALLGGRAATLYDGSLAEWSADPELPMEVHVDLP